MVARLRPPRRLAAYFSAAPPAEPFRLFGPAHLTAIGAIGGGLAALVAGRHAPPSRARRVRNALVCALWGQEICFHGWRWATGRWSTAEMLPLHACSTALWAGGLGALTGRRALQDYVWYLGVAGATQAILTPDLAEYGPRHAQFAQFFLSHGLLVAVPVHLMVTEGYRPTWRGALRTWLLLGAQALVASAVNRRVGGNYLFVSRKPETTSLLDRFPPWPQYIPVLWAVTGGAIALLTLPFTRPPWAMRPPWATRPPRAVSAP